MTHFRSGTISWEPVFEAEGDATNTVKIRVDVVYRRSYPVSSFREFSNPDNSKLPGDTLVYQNLRFAGNVSAPLQFLVTAVNLQEDWLYGVAHVTHTFSEPGTYMAWLESCCRLSGLQNANDTQYRLETLIHVGEGKRSPVTGMPPLVQAPLGGVTSLQIPHAHPDGNEVRFRFADPSETGAGHVQPPDLSVSESGLVTWDTTEHSSGLYRLWNTQVVMEGLDDTGEVVSRVPLEFLIHLVEEEFSEPPVFDAFPEEALHPVAGEPFSFEVQASDPDELEVVMLSALNAPEGMTFEFVDPAEDAADNAVRLQATWTPASGNVGSAYVITFRATNHKQAMSDIAVTVLPAPGNRPPVAAAGGPYGLVMGSDLVLDASGSFDPDGDELTFAWDLSGNGEFDDASGPTPVLTWSDLADLGLNAPGTFTIAVRADDGKASHTVATTLHIVATSPSLVPLGIHRIADAAPDKPPLRVHWPAEPGFRYLLEKSTDLDGWSPATGFPATAEGSILEFRFERQPGADPLFFGLSFQP
ncbi:MAG: hypothetical protein JJU00_02035 [Opitutales bacterium]|nr:hypothetical protein [Opitutales bacterium]